MQEKPLVSAEARDYTFDHIEGIENNLAGEGLQLAEMMGGLNALQKAVNERLAKTDCPVRGKVTIVYVVDEKGVVLDTATAAGIHEICDQIAEDAVRDMVFSPARKNGEPVKIRMGSPVVFN
ncbi:MAG: energy transducer TonB [Bacteroidota bacterium]